MEYFHQAEDKYPKLKIYTLEGSKQEKRMIFGLISNKIKTCIFNVQGVVCKTLRIMMRIEIHLCHIAEEEAGCRVLLHQVLGGK